MKKEYLSAPLPFVGQKRMFAKEYIKVLGEALQQARKEKGYTLRHLAKFTGIKYNHIARIESGRYNVAMDTVAVIAAALGRKIDIV